MWLVVAVHVYAARQCLFRTDERQALQEAARRTCAHRDLALLLLIVEQLLDIVCVLNGSRAAADRAGNRTRFNLRALAAQRRSRRPVQPLLRLEQVGAPRRPSALRCHDTVEGIRAVTVSDGESDPPLAQPP